MAGGVGSRFWPLSKKELPKQFLDILGVGETFIQQRDIACHRLDGGYEIVPGYHSIE